MRKVLTAASPPEAHVAVAVLENSGIDAVIQGEHMGGLPMGHVSRPSVWVRDEDYTTACEVLGVAPEPMPSNEPTSPLWILFAVILALALMLLLQP